MKTCVCKILKKNGIFGTGFFCKIPYYNDKQSLVKIPVLITNNHILNLNDIENDRIITVTKIMIIHKKNKKWIKQETYLQIKN